MSQMSKAEELLARLKGRMENNQRTADQHPDPRVRHDALVRVKAYESALADAEGMLREFKAGQWVRHKESGMTLKVDDVQCRACHCPHNGQAGQVLILRYFVAGDIYGQYACASEDWEIVQ